MRKLHLRTKVLLSVLAGLIIVVGGLFIWKPSLFKSSASTMLPVLIPTTYYPGPTSTMLPGPTPTMFTGPITFMSSSIKGRVNGPNNTSLSPVTVEAFKGSETVVYSRTGTDANGNYLIRNLPANTQFTLKFTAFQGYRTVKQTVTTKPLLLGLMATVTANQSMQPYGYGKLIGTVYIGGKPAPADSEFSIYLTKSPDYLGMGDRIGCQLWQLQPLNKLRFEMHPIVKYTCPFAEGTYTARAMVTGAINSELFSFTITSGKDFVVNIDFGAIING